MGKKLGFGCMRLPLLDRNDQTSVDMDAFKKLVDTFLERGFAYFETAYVYHGSKSEEFVREALVERHRRDEFMLATKLPPRILKSEEDQDRIFGEQLEKCGVDFFDYYLVHNIGVNSYRQALEFDTFGFVQRMKHERRIRNAGMSFHDTPRLLDEVLTAHPELDFVQLQINYIDWENPGIQSRKCYEVARKHGKPIIVMEPCRGGNLAVVPEEAERIMKAFNPDASIPSWAIRFAAGQEGVFMVLSGMNTMEQVLDNTSYMADLKPLNEEEYRIISRVTEIISADTAVPCTACQYCVADCPKNIAIPDYFALYNSAMRAVTTNTSSQFVYYLNLASTHGKAGDCIGCKKCEAACPQHINITKFLRPWPESSGKMTGAIPFEEESMKKILVAYFSRADYNYAHGSIVKLSVGNTETAARIIQKLTGGDLFRIDTIKKYPADYHEATRVAQQEQRSNARPELTSQVENMGDYDIVVLGYPNWWGTIPMAMWTFLESYDFSGKTLLPFCTHEGSGMGHSEGDIKRLCPHATVRGGLAVRGGNVQNAEKEIAAWLHSSGVVK